MFMNRREGTKVPIIITSCVDEIQNRGWCLYFSLLSEIVLVVVTCVGMQDRTGAGQDRTGAGHYSKQSHAQHSTLRPKTMSLCPDIKSTNFYSLTRRICVAKLEVIDLMDKLLIQWVTGRYCGGPPSQKINVRVEPNTPLIRLFVIADLGNGVLIPLSKPCLISRPTGR